MSWLIFCLSKDAVLRWEQTTSAVIQRCPDCPPPHHHHQHHPHPPPPQVQVKPVGMLHPEKLLNYFHDILVFIFLFFPHKAVLKSYNLIKVWHNSTTSSDKICAHLVLFLSLFPGFCVKVSCYVSAQIQDGGLDACIYSDRNATQHAFEPLCCSAWNIYVKAEWMWVSLRFEMLGYHEKLCDVNLLMAQSATQRSV